MKQEYRTANSVTVTADAPQTLALEAARLRIAAALKKRVEPAKVRAIPMTLRAMREDNSPYRKESRQ